MHKIIRKGVISICLFAFLFAADTLQSNGETSKVYIVYLGGNQHDNPDLVTSGHHDLLASVLGSRKASANSMIYSYRHGFSGFAAKLTESQAQKIAELPGVIDVSRNSLYKLQTTRSWDYLGLSSSSSSSSSSSRTHLLHDTKFGEDTIIGLLDSGIMPESESFADDGLGPIPSKWKGGCDSYETDPKMKCNRKLIGARFFYKGLEEELKNRGKQFSVEELKENLSPRDAHGHGTHTASIAGGLLVPNVNFHGLAKGIARGGAPRARLAVYKVAWGQDGLISSTDMLKAFDMAIHDGVDVLSVSLGREIPLYPEIDKHIDGIYHGSFHAVEKGIPVVCSAGNSGPTAQTVEDVAPWVITVAATTTDRSFPTPIILGNSTRLTGQSMFHGDTGFVELISPYPRPCGSLSLNDASASYDTSLSSNDTKASGKVVFFYATGGDNLKLANQIGSLISGTNTLGIIVAGNPTRTIDPLSFPVDFPVIFVTYEVGSHIHRYIYSSRKKPTVQLKPSETYIGEHASTYVARFSSRGPNSISPAILKPDIAAPGVNILAALPPFSDDSGTTHRYGFMSGTSMAAPHVSGIVALLKSLYPRWSPAAIRSALVTTAWTMDPNSGEPILAEGDVTRVADPFDFGGGLVNPNRARDPGLVYDTEIEDYTQYLCSMGYKEKAIKKLTKKGKLCSGATISSALDLNLPSITIPALTAPIKVTRTVTNVGDINSHYKAIITPPQGITIVVEPDHLIFSPEVKKISFVVTISTSRVSTKYYFGSLTWTDGLHEVIIPISVRSFFPELAF